VTPGFVFQQEPWMPGAVRFSLSEWLVPPLVVPLLLGLLAWTAAMAQW
jgi:hypothetical protein